MTRRTRTTDPLEGAHVLAEVDYIHVPRGEKLPNFARLLPLTLHTGGQWETVEEASSLFPDDGFIFWWQPASSIVCGSIWHAVLELHPKHDQPRHDKFQARNAEPATECAMAETGIDERKLREALNGDGISQRFCPVGRALIKLTDGRWVGPLKLTDGRGKNRWIADEEELRVAEVRKLEDASLVQLQTRHGRRVVLSPRRPLPPPVNHLNLQSSLTVLHSVVKRIRKLDRATHSALKMTYRAYDGYLQAIDRSGLAEPGLEVERARAEGVRRALETMKANESFLAETADALLGHPSVAARVDDAIAADIDRRVKEAGGEISKKLATAESQLAVAQKQLAQERDRLVAVQTELAETKGAIAEELKRAEETMRERVDEFRKQPIGLLTDSLLVRTVTEALGGDDAGARRPDETPSGSRATAQDFEGDQLDSLPAIREALARSALEAGISPYAVQIAFGVLLAGGVPVVFGAQTDALIGCLSRSLSGGETHWLPVSSATYQVQDLFGHLNADGTRYIPAAGSLLPAVMTAQQERVLVAVLGGVNRAPPEAYLGPIGRAIRTGAGREISVPIPTGATGVSQAPDGALRWPSQLLMVGTVIEGSSAFPIPRSMLTDLVLIPTQFGPPQPDIPALEGVPTLSACDPDLLAHCREVVSTGVPEDRVAAIMPRVPCSSHSSHTQVLRLVSGIQVALGEDAAPEQSVAASILLRLLPSTPPQDRDSLLSALALAPPVTTILEEEWATDALESIDAWLRSGISTTGRGPW